MAKRDPKDVESSEEEEAYEVERILKHKVEKDEDGKKVLLFKIRWKGYKAEDDTWEPRSNIEEGAGTVLQDYIAAKEAEGNAVVDPADKKKKPRASEPVKKAEPVEKKKPRASEIRLPDSRDSSLSSSKKAKKPDSIVESVPSSKRDKATNGHSDAPDSAASKRKSSKTASPVGSDVVKVTRKPESAPPSKSSDKKNGKKRSADADERIGEEEPVEVARAPAKKAKSSKETPEVVVPATNKETGSYIHRRKESWDDLLTVDTLEVATDEPGGVLWFVKWHDSPIEGITEDVAREKCPQRLIDFFKSNLKFKDTDPEADGEPMEED